MPEPIEPSRAEHARCPRGRGRDRAGGRGSPSAPESDARSVRLVGRQDVAWFDGDDPRIRPERRESRQSCLRDAVGDGRPARGRSRGVHEGAEARPPRRPEKSALTTGSLRGVQPPATVAVPFDHRGAVRRPRARGNRGRRTTVGARSGFRSAPGRRSVGSRGVRSDRRRQSVHDQSQRGGLGIDAIPRHAVAHGCEPRARRSGRGPLRQRPVMIDQLVFVEDSGAAAGRAGR